MKKLGTWGLWSKGTNPKRYDQWSEEDTSSMEFAEILSSFLKWKDEGQHVRLEWIPDGTYGLEWRDHS